MAARGNFGFVPLPATCPEHSPSKQTREERFVALLDRSIAFHRTNQNDPHGIGNAVVASLAEVRSAYVEAFNLKL